MSTDRHVMEHRVAAPKPCNYFCKFTPSTSKTCKSCHQDQGATHEFVLPTNTAGTAELRKRKVRANPPVSDSSISMQKTVRSTPAPPLVVIPQSFSPKRQHLPPNTAGTAEQALPNISKLKTK